jgi:SAM-dependent methyltransferase
VKSHAEEGRPDRVIRLQERNCENCGGSDLELLWHQSFTARTRAGNYIFDVNNVICRNCGFVFVSPVFHEEDLADYYRESFSAFKDASLDYDVEKRLEFLEAVARKGAAFVEVGANQPTHFHQHLKNAFEKVATVEINNSVSSDFQSLDALPTDSIDVVAHYFVLEHVPRVVKFLSNCHRVLREGGVMVCEVPDIHIYPDNPTALLLYEHTNHFSRKALCGIASRVGFDVLKIDASLCSRDFGFAAAFRKSKVQFGCNDASEFQENRTLLLRGVRDVERMWTEMDLASERLKAYRRRGVTVIFWAVNDLMARFFDHHPSSGDVTIVDSNPEKANFFRGARVLTPSAAETQIRNADAIFIFTRLHAAEILRQMEYSISKQFKPDHVHVVDPFGGSLPR